MGFHTPPRQRRRLLPHTSTLGKRSADCDNVEDVSLSSSSSNLCEAARHDSEHLYAEEDVAERRRSGLQQSPSSPTPTASLKEAEAKPRVFRSSWSSWFASPEQPPCRKRMRNDEADGIPETLARLLQTYLPSSRLPVPAPTPDASLNARRQKTRHEKSACDIGSNTRSSGVRDGGGNDAPSSLEPPTAKGTLSSVTDTAWRWSRFLPPHWTQPRDASTALQTPARDSAAQQQQHQQKPSSTMRCAHRPPMLHHKDSIAEGQSTAFQQHEADQKQLWFLLSKYPQDASACLSLSRSLCDILAIMRDTPPPSLPSSTQSVESRGLKATSHTETETCTAATRTGTCPCGCLVRGRYVDPPLFSYHHAYYYSQQSLAKAEIRPSWRDAEEDVMQEAQTVPSEPASSSGREGPHPMASACSAELFPNAFGPAHPRAGLSGARHLQRPSESWQQQQQQQQLAWHSPPSTTSLQMALQVEVMPLLAIQTLAGFVQKSSEKQSALSERRASRIARRARMSKKNNLSGSGAAPPVIDGDTRPRCCFANAKADSRAPADEEAADAFAQAYRSFCGEKNRLWAAMACVRLAWCQLQQRCTRALFIPQLEVLSLLHEHTDQQQQHSASDASPSRRVSGLVRAAAACNMSPESLAAQLLRSLGAACRHTSFGASAEAFHRLRVRLMMHVSDSRHDHTRDCRGDDAGHTGHASLSSSSSAQSAATKELLAMEISVLTSVGGQTARMPLWCRVAMEVLQLYFDSSRRHRAMSSCDKVRMTADMVACTTLREKVYFRQVRQLVRLLMQLLLLPAVSVVAARLPEGKRRARASPRPPPPPISSSNAASFASPRAPLAALPASTIEEINDITSGLSSLMLYHPLFGVAAAVASGAVPLHWAATCLAGTAADTLGPHASSAAAGRVTRGEEVAREVGRLADAVQRWLRQPKEREERLC